MDIIEKCGISLNENKDMLLRGFNREKGDSNQWVKRFQEKIMRESVIRDEDRSNRRHQNKRERISNEAI